MSEKAFYENDKLLMKIVIEGMYPFSFKLMDIEFKGKVLDEEEYLEVVNASNGLDIASKIPFQRFETLSRAIKELNSNKIVNKDECAKFLKRLNPFVVDTIYKKYDEEAKMCEVKLQQMISEIKNLQRDQTTEKLGDGSKNSSQTGPDKPTQPPQELNI